ncbi:MAG: non-ribosomal peptide synthetase, partial [Deltaproteobacteria bacterium]
RRPGFRREDTMLAVTTLSFDIAALEIFLPLFCGGRVVIADAEETIDMERLKARIVGAGVTVVQTTPARWRMLLAAGWPEASFRIWCGAEALPADLAAELLDHGELWNLYGPTEATIWATIHRVSLIEEGKIVPIGRPIANMEVFILDERLRPVPVGVPGEICIAGPGLARGYLNRPDLTAEKFVSLPLLGGKRVYRTGDLGRRRHDGTLEFLGRRDDQVKFRGHRIELGEIAANLEAHPAVRHCAVTMRGKHPGEEHLVAFYTSPSPPPDPEELRRFLGERLPDYMVPGFFVHLEALPLNPSGKVDKGALARIEVERPTKTFVAPRTPIETRIAEIWQEVLDIERVGVFDDFFALGGHSLLATRILARLRETFGADLPLRALFECRTVAGLAEAITARSANASMLPPITPIPREGELPLSFAQQRLWFIEELQPGNVKSTIPGLVRIRGPLDVDLLRESLRDLCQRQESLRTAFGARGGRPFQRVVPEVEVPLDSVDLSEEADPDRVLHADAERRVAHPFDLSKPPLFRVTLYRLGPAEHVLLLVMHHIVSDGWSIEIFFRETTLLYAARIRGESTHLPPLTVQYIDHAYWQRRWMQGEVLQEQLGYWKRQLAGAPPALDLPTDRPRPPIQTFSGATETKDLPPALTEALKALAARRGATLFMLLLAAFKVLLSRLAGQED